MHISMELWNVFTKAPKYVKKFNQTCYMETLKKSCKPLHKFVTTMLQIKGFKIVFNDVYKYKCKYCQRFFAEPWYLKKHIKTQHLYGKGLRPVGRTYRNMIIASDIKITSDQHPNKINKYYRYSKKQKEMFIQFYELGMSVKEASSMAEINCNTAKSIIRSYKKNDSELIQHPRGGCRRKKLTEDVLNQIESFVERNPTATLQEIRSMLAQRNINVSKSAIDNGLRNLKITMHLAALDVERINHPETIAYRKVYASEFSKRYHEIQQKMIFIDECLFNLKFHRKQSQVLTPVVRDRNLTLIAAMSNEKLVHTKVLSQLSCNSAKFCQFLLDLSAKLGPSWSNCLIVMNNVRVNKTKEIKDVVERLGFILQVMPPFSPMLNPMEKLFSQIKYHIRQSISMGTHDHCLVQLVEAGIRKISSTDCSQVILDMIMLLEYAAAGMELN